MKSVKISSKGLELSGFPTWLNVLVIIGAAAAFIASFWLVPKAINGNSTGLVSLAIALFIVCIVLFFFVGRVYDRSRASSYIYEKVERAKQESRGEIQPSAPVAPSALSVSPVSDSQVNLSWADNSDSEEGFKIERKLGVEGNYAPLVILGPNATSYSDVGLAPDTNALYRIKAFNTHGESPYANDASGTTSATTVKGNDNSWTNPTTWFWYVILPVAAMLLLLCSVLSYLFFKYQRMREHRLYEEMHMRHSRTLLQAKDS